MSEIFTTPHLEKDKNSTASSTAPGWHTNCFYTSPVAHPKQGKFYETIKKFAAAALLFASSAFANAGMITFDVTDTTPVGTFKVEANKPFTFDFDFNDGTFDFIKGKDTITAAWLTVQLSDNGGSETFKFFLNSDEFFDDKNIPGNSNNPQITAYTDLSLGNSLVAALNKDGFLNLSIGISAGNGSFNVVSSSLRAQVEREVKEVPEPMSAALLGLGLAGIAGIRRRKA